MASDWSCCDDRQRLAQKGSVFGDRSCAIDMDFLPLAETANDPIAQHRRGKPDCGGGYDAKQYGDQNSAAARSRGRFGWLSQNQIDKIQRTNHEDRCRPESGLFSTRGRCVAESAKTARNYAQRQSASIQVPNCATPRPTWKLRHPVTVVRQRYSNPGQAGNAG